MGSGGGSGSTTTTTDPTYNAGMLNLSEEQQGWAKEMFNQFKYGVPYDPTEVQSGAYVDANGKVVASAAEGGQWVSSDDILKKDEYKHLRTKNPEYEKASKTGHWEERTTGGGGDGGVMGTTTRTWVTDSNLEDIDEYMLNPEFASSRNMGEAMGYNPDAVTSEMEYLQNLVESNQGLLGLETDVSRLELEGRRDLLPGETALAREQTEAARRLLPQATAATERRLGLFGSVMDDATKGIDVNKRMSQAEAGVEHGFKEADQVNRMNLQQFGLDPSSGRYASQNRASSMRLATGIAGARTKASEDAEKEDFARKTTALGLSL